MHDTGLKDAVQKHRNVEAADVMIDRDFFNYLVKDKRDIIETYVYRILDALESEYGNIPESLNVEISYCLTKIDRQAYWPTKEYIDYYMKAEDEKH